MFFIPYGHKQIKSKLKVDEIERRLKSQLDPHSIISGMFRGDHKYFQGNINNGEFKISRIIHYKNSFRPVITGKVQSEIDHNVIDLTLRLDFAVLAVFLFITLGFASEVLMPTISFMLQSWFSGQPIEFMQYLPNGSWLNLILSSAGWILFLYLFMMIPFNIEAQKATKYLDELFENQLDHQSSRS